MGTSTVSLVYMQGAWLNGMEVNSVIILFLQIISGIVFYVGLLFLFNRVAVQSLLSEFFNKKVRV